MMKILYRIAAVASAMLLSAAVPAVRAEASEPQGIVLTSAVQTDGKKPDRTEQYTVVLKALDTGDPMPSGSTDGIYELIFSGEGKKDFPPLVFTSAGTYRYQICQKPGKSQNARYDNTIYTVTVYVLNSGNEEDEKICTAVLENEATGKKVNEVVFRNTYDSPDTPPKTGDDSNITMYVVMGAFGTIGLIYLLLYGDKEKAKRK